MKHIKFLIFIIGVFLFSQNSYASDKIELLNSIKKYNQTYITNRADFLRTFCGDTIMFNITGVNHLSYFRQELPDTIWIKSRPKKNPVEGKHYRLIYTYKAQVFGDEYSTPISEINNKPFAVLSVDEITDYTSYYISSRFTVIKLVDLDDLSVITVKLPEKISCEIPFTSTKCERIKKALIGNKYYIRQSKDSFSTKVYYDLATLESCKVNFCLINSTAYPATSNVEFKFVFEDGREIQYPFKNSYSYSKSPEILSEEDYLTNYTIKTINSNINTTVLDQQMELPFNFEFILATTNSMAKISQTINPVDSYNSNQSIYLFNSAVISIGGKLKVKNKEYYKAFYRGKAFFIESSYVTFSDEMKLKADSLDLLNEAQANYFFNFSLSLAKNMELQIAKGYISELENFAKYGLAISDWGSYDESEYTDGTSVRFNFYNPTKKVIKYITINYVGYNSVDDPVSSRGKSVMTSKCIGPIEPDSFATYEFEYVWFTDIVDYAKIRSIVVQYRDGTSKTITNAKSIMFSDDLNSWINRPNEVKDFD